MDLFKLFVESYQKYKSFLKEEPLDVHTKSCMTLFGIPGVGKSTFLARLLSDYSAEDFNKNIINRPLNHENITVAQVDIGRSSSSVTMVPRLFKIGELLLYDAPGFKDSNADKNIIINILHKCLLNHIVKNKFIVVFKLTLLDDERMNSLISDYYKSFQLLFGENYRSCIDNIYFVITHIDKSTINIDDLGNIITERMISAIDLNESQLAFFMKRLARYHMVVDYNRDDQNTVVEKLWKMVSDNSKGMEQDQIIKTQLNTFENDLDKEIVRKLTSLLQTFKSKYILEKENIEKIFEEIKQAKDKMVVYNNQITSMGKRSNEISDFLKTVDGSINQMKSNIAKYQSEHALNLKQVSEIDSLLDIYDKIITNFDVLTYRVDTSFKPMLSSTHYIKLRLCLNPNYHKERIILVVKFENDDITFKRFLNKDTLLPNNMNEILNFRGNGVLYNHGVIIDDNLKITKNSFTDNTNVLEFEAEFNSPFKVFVYSKTTAKHANIDFRMKEKFNDDKRNLINGAEEILTKIANLEQEIKILIDKDKDKRSELFEIENKIGDLKSEISNNQQHIEKQKEFIKNELETLHNINSSLVEDMGFKNAKIIEDIFKENRIVPGFSKDIKNINELSNNVMNYYQTVKKTYLV